MDEFGARVAVVDVVGVLPDIQGEQRSVPGSERSMRVLERGDAQLAGLVQHEPGPAGAEELHCRVGKGLFEGGEITKIPRDQIRHLAGRRAAAGGREATPVKAVVPVLRGVVENGRVILGVAGDDDFREGAFGERGVAHQRVEVVNVGGVVLAVMIGEPFLGDDRNQGTRIVGQIG